LSDPRFNNPNDLSLVPEVDGAFIAWLMERTKQEASEQLQSKNTICTPFNTPADIFNDRHFKERNFWVEIDHPVAGRLTYPGAPIDMPDGGYQIRRPAPLLGQHNEEILCGVLGYSNEELVRLRGMKAV